MLFNYRVIINILGTLLMLNGMFMLSCIPFSLYYKEGDLFSIILSATITASFGFLMWFFTKNSKNKELRKRDGYLVVTFGWLIMSFFGSLPYILSGSIPNLTDAFFETLSGFSTTGATILTDIEAVHKGILFWRSLTQWIGGMGIIVLTVAILPILGIGGMQLFVAEAPGISPDKLQPRIKETAKRLWFIYLGLTLTETVLLWVGGMTFYDAINHGLTTMATGGFSTKNASIAYYASPYIQYVIILFMFLAGTNFTMTYLVLHKKFRKVFQNEEFRFYSGFCLVAGLVIGIVIFSQGHDTFEKSIRDSLFQVVSIITTTGFITADYTSWTPFITILFVVMMFFGASAGSTAGGVKIVRHIILVKNSLMELKRQLHPNAVIPIRLNGKAVSREITYNILAFIMIYISIFALGSVVMGMLGADFNTAIGSVATCLGNIGPGIGDVGPVDNFASISAPGKWVLAFLMLLGRLELFTVLMLFTPYFWKTN
ncbi:TrkH family potassium uptake protein [Marinoscillum sp. 108]|jgi:trk system potassium uptake protein|uniref:TrkH family potassium uptake protein n=1 Tax=Marinoscillum luteum TaxID=861051 RepID=A0ABW7N6L0_9BACT|nr:TrkH family potassium uptake protein [Marinoscillum sp. 108]VXD17727.1 Trk system potassium uptake protein TrkH [Marinoscillum sp. 108]